MTQRYRGWGRLLFNMLTAVSLFLAIATAGLWVRSGYLDQRVNVLHRRLSGELIEAIDLDINVRCGTFFVRYESSKRQGSRLRGVAYSVEDVAAFRRGEPVFKTVVGSGALEASGYSPSLSERVFGDGETFNARRTSSGAWLLRFPLWLPLALLCILPTVCVMSVIRHRKPPGHCPACGYDTRANPARCSECGHEVP